MTMVELILESIDIRSEIADWSSRKKSILAFGAARGVFDETYVRESESSLAMTFSLPVVLEVIDWICVRSVSFVCSSWSITCELFSSALEEAASNRLVSV